MAEVRIQEGKSLKNALRQLKRKAQREDVVKEIKRHSLLPEARQKLRVKEALTRNVAAGMRVEKRINSAWVVVPR